MRGQVIFFIFRRIGALFANFCVKMKKKSKKVWRERKSRYLCSPFQK